MGGTHGPRAPRAPLRAWGGQAPPFGAGPGLEARESWGDRGRGLSPPAGCVPFSRARNMHLGQLPAQTRPRIPHTPVILSCLAVPANCLFHILGAVGWVGCRHTLPEAYKARGRMGAREGPSAWPCWRWCWGSWGSWGFGCCSAQAPVAPAQTRTGHPGRTRCPSSGTCTCCGCPSRIAP